MPKKHKRVNIILNCLDDNHSTNESVSDTTSSKTKLLLYFLMICYIFIIVKIINLSLNPKLTPEIIGSKSQARGNIFDRNGHILAVNLPTKSIYIKPEETIDLDATIRKILEITTGKNNLDNIIKSLKQRVSSGKKFIWIQRHLLPNIYAQLKLLGLPGVYIINDSKRFYPHENEFSHVVGFVDIDQKGISGVEKEFDNTLANGEDVHLSLDIAVQSTVRFSLNNSISSHEALGGMAVVMDVRNGEVISLVSLPDFNPNGQKIDNPEAMFNRATLGVYEMGSTFKILTLAIGLDTGSVRITDSFNVSQPIKLGKYLIKDYKFHKANLSFPEVLIFSSNRGVGQIGMKIGISNQQDYLGNLGMLSPVTTEIGEKGKPIHVSQKKWNDVYLVTISYGHGIAVTPLHAVQAIAAVTNGGILYKPTILKQTSQPEGTRIFQEKTSKIMRKIMRRVVEEGYAKKAEVEGYNIGGKTGTAEKVKNGRYMKNNCNLASFLGAYPIDNPRYVIFVAVDEPKPNKLNAGFTTGGWVAAPLAADILRSAGPFLQE